MQVSHIISKSSIKFCDTSRFYVHIKHIVRLRPNEKMRRIYAKTIVTTMKHTHSYGNCPEMLFPCNPMGPFSSLGSSISVYSFRPFPLNTFNTVKSEDELRAHLFFLFAA